MKQLITVSLLVVFLCNSYATVEVLPWPIDGCKVGENILSKPEDLIDNEINKSNLFIGGELHSIVLAPSDGIVENISFKQMNSLTRQTNYKLYCPRTGKTSTRDSFPKDVYISLGIKAKNGVKYWISGLDSIENFVTGQRVSKGDALGKMGYAYSKINQPHICFSKSVNSISTDPMTPFGLESSFLAIVPDKTNYTTYKHSVENLNEDFDVFRNALEEGHSGLYDFATKKDMDSLFVNIKSKLDKPMTSQEFLNTIRPVIRQMRDSHTSIKIYKKIKHKYSKSKHGFLPILFCLQNDSLIVYSTSSKHNELFGKSITSIDGVPKDSIIKNTKCHAYGKVVGNIESKKESFKHAAFSSFYSKSYPKEVGTEVSLIFSDSSEVRLKYGTFKNELYDTLSKRRNERIQKAKNHYITSIVSDSIAVIDLNTFNLLDKEIEDVKAFIKSLDFNNIRHLAIDLRRNPGGNIMTIAKLYSAIAAQGYKIEISRKVNKTGKLSFLEYTFNYPPNQEMYTNFKPIEGKEGFYLDKGDMPSYQPDSVAYKGNIFVLIDENSYSASSVFAGLIHRNNRGVIIGRETGSLYHRLNASDYARLNLSNTKIEVRIPLVQSVYEWKEESDIHWGRGVLPDYEIPLTYQERLYENDVFLEKALRIIRDYQPKEQIEEAHISKGNPQWNYLIYGFLGLVIILASLYVKKKRKTPHNRL